MTPQLIGYDEYGNPIYVDEYGNYIDPAMLSDGAIPVSSGTRPHTGTEEVLAVSPTGEVIGDMAADPRPTHEGGRPIVMGDLRQPDNPGAILLPQFEMGLDDWGARSRGEVVIAGVNDYSDIPGPLMIAPTNNLGDPPPPDANVPAEVVDSSGGGSGGSSGGGSSRGGGGGGGSSSSSSSSSSDDEGFFRGRDPMSNIPAYADGRVHPAAGGDPLTPGGRFNDGSSGGRGRANVRGGGSTNRYYRPGYERRYNKAPGNTFGLGRPDMPYRKQQALERHWNVRNQIMGQLPPIFGGGGGGTAEDGTAAGGGGGGNGRDKVVGETDTRRLRGWAGRQGYTGAGLKELLETKPEALLMDVFSGLSTGSAAYQNLRSIPTADLVMLANAGNKKWLGEHDTTANTMAKMWREVATKPRWFDFQSLFRNLSSPKKGSPLHQLTAGGSAAQNEYYFDKYANALFDTTMSADTALAYKQRLEDLQTEYANLAAKRKNPAKGPSQGQYIKNRLFR